MPREHRCRHHIFWDDGPDSQSPVVSFIIILVRPPQAVADSANVEVGCDSSENMVYLHAAVDDLQTAVPTEVVPAVSHPHFSTCSIYLFCIVDVEHYVAARVCFPRSITVSLGTNILIAGMIGVPLRNCAKRPLDLNKYDCIRDNRFKKDAMCLIVQNLKNPNVYD